MTRRLLAAFAALLVLGTLLTGAVGALPSDQQAESEYTLEELRQDGKHYAEPSVRIVPSEHRMYWLEHRPVNQPWRDVTRAKNGKKLDGTLKTNAVYLRTILATDTAETVNVTLVYYDVATKQVSKGNTTTTKRYAANVSVVEKSVTLKPGFSVAKITLPQHSEPTHVTMWLNEHPDKARWTFTHHSVALTQPLDADTWSEFVLLGAGFIMLPALAVGWYGSRKVSSWIDTAGAPPGHGATYVATVATVVTGGVVLGAYYYAAEVIVTLPVVLGIYVGVVYVGYMLATHTGRTEEKLFWQPHIESVDAFTSTKMPSIGSHEDGRDSLSFAEDMPFGQMQQYKVLDEGQDGLSIVRDGWFAFLARLKGGRARIENADELKTRFSLWDSEWSEVFIVDPEAETLIEYEPPGLRLKMPEIDGWTDLVWPLGLLGGGGFLAYRATEIYGPTAYAVLLAVVPILVWKFAVEGTDSYVHVDPAPAAMRPVLASMLAMNIGYRDASTLEEAEEFAWRALAGQEKEEMSWERDRDDTYIDESFRTPKADDSGSDVSEGGDDVDHDPDEIIEVEGSD